MSDKTQDQGKGFIREKIVPRKNLKRALISTLSAIGLGLVFGIAAAMAFFTSQDFLEGKSQTQPTQQIIIIRDDTQEASSDSGEVPETASSAVAVSSRETEEEPQKSQESTEEMTSSAEDDTKDNSGTGPEMKDTTEPDRTADTTEPTSPAETGENGEIPEIRIPDETAEELTPADIYKKIMNGIVSIRITRNRGTDWFDDELLAESEAFGVIIGETDKDFFVLTDSANIRDEDTLTVAMNGYVIYASVQGRDERTHLAVIRLPKSPDPGDAAVIPLGNSFLLKPLTEIYMTGAPRRINGETMHGMITNIVDDVPVTDGYQQLIYTDMARLSGGSAVLFTEEGKIVGWVSDYTGQEGTDIAAAAGISPLKYLIEDAMSGNETAYLGIRCTQVTAYDAVVNGMEEGLYISSVEADSPAFLSGLQTGDRLVSLDGKRVTGSHVLQIRLDQDIAPGQEIEVVVERRSAAGYEPLTLKVTAGRR